MTDEDKEKLKKQAKEWNDMICAQEGYNPVGEDWILTNLIIAFNLGVLSANNLSDNLRMATIR